MLCECGTPRPASASDPCITCGKVPDTAKAKLAAHLSAAGEKLEDAGFVLETMQTARIIAAELFAVEGEIVALDPDVLFDVYDRLERREKLRWERLALLTEDVRKARGGR